MKAPFAGGGALALLFTGAGSIALDPIVGL
jgi:hypothetical protein